MGLKGAQTPRNCCSQHSYASVPARRPCFNCFHLLRKLGTTFLVREIGAGSTSLSKHSVCASGDSGLEPEAQRVQLRPGGCQGGNTGGGGWQGQHGIRGGASSGGWGRAGGVAHVDMCASGNSRGTGQVQPPFPPSRPPFTPAPFPSAAFLTEDFLLHSSECV